MILEPVIMEYKRLRAGFDIWLLQFLFIAFVLLF